MVTIDGANKVVNLDGGTIGNHRRWKQIVNLYGGTIGNHRRWKQIVNLDCGR